MIFSVVMDEMSVKGVSVCEEIVGFASQQLHLKDYNKVSNNNEWNQDVNIVFFNTK